MSSAVKLEDFTVGWICALESEFTAARAALDEEYTGLDEQDLQDHNIYKFGRIGKHEVVLACLPTGKNGGVSAATVAKDMLRSFSSLRFGLMVGIGRGLPSKDVDIRLGDVVVSHPTADDGGVIQYDFTHVLPGGMFARRGVLNKPPLVLLTAAQILKSDYALKGSKVPVILDNMADKFPRQRQNFKRPHPAEVPFEAECEHTGEDICSQCRTRFEEWLVNRVDDGTGQVDTAPHIHYGLIASDSNILPSKQAREQLRKTAPIICFEMEASGLMDSFPCLVIRGIYDYADSCKRDGWERYAAAAAAAYARELLEVIPLGKVQSMATAQTVVNGLIIGLDTTVSVAQSVQDHDNGERQVMLRWLSASNSSAQHADYTEQRQPGTGQWLLDSPEYRAWIGRRKATLFCPGIPGAGKTMIACAVVQQLQATFREDAKTGICYVYCSYTRQGEQTLGYFLAIMVKQLSEALDTLPEGLKRLHERHSRKKSKPSVSEYLEVLKGIMTGLSATFIVVDGLDEWAFEPSVRDQLLDTLFEFQTSYGAQLFVTSRFIQDITRRFKGIPSVEIRAARQDIDRYLQSHLTEFASTIQGSKTLQKDMLDAIADSSDGMFILARLHFDSLRDMFQPAKIKSALKTLKERKFKEKSEALKWAYKKVIEKIEAQSSGHVHFAKQVISWLTCAKKPLTVPELRHALAAQEDGSYGEEDLVGVKDILSVCCNLLMVDENTQIIRFIHHTAHDFFQSIRQMWLPDAYTLVASSCISYLSNDTFQVGVCQSDEAFHDRLRSYPFLEFAAHNWGNFANKGDLNQLRPSVLDLLSKPGNVASCFEVIMNSRFTYREYNEHSPDHPTGAHLASYFHLENFIRLTLERGSGRAESRNEDKPKPLAWIEKAAPRSGMKLLVGRQEADAEEESSKPYIKKEPL